jgi:hypothetical protein
MSPFALKEFLAMTPPADQTGGMFAPPIGLALLFASRS